LFQSRDGAGDIDIYIYIYEIFMDEVTALFLYNTTVHDDDRKSTLCSNDGVACGLAYLRGNPAILGVFQTFVVEFQALRAHA